jgi:hypothetical protein
MPDVPTFSEWCVLELMGHRRLAGKVTEVQIAGAGVLRLDVPGDDGEPDVTQFYAPSALNCITPTTEANARAMAKRYRPAPVHRYELPALAPARATVASDGYDQNDSPDDDDEEEDR